MEQAELIPRSFARGILNSMWGAVREEDGDLLSNFASSGDYSNKYTHFKK